MKIAYIGKIPNHLKLSIIAVIIGLLSALTTLLFRYLIAVFSNLLLENKLSFIFNPYAPLKTLFKYQLIFITPTGLLISAYLIKKFASEKILQGVSEVMAAVLKEKSKLPIRCAAIKIVASAITIGSGGAVGREGPIVHAGSSIGSFIGDKLSLSYKEKTILVATGAASGIAATFNTPIAGVLFAIELLMLEYSTKTLTPLVIGASIATYTTRTILGSKVTFSLHHVFSISSHWELLAYAGLGLVIAPVSIILIKSISYFKKIANHFLPNWKIKAIVIGIIIAFIGLITKSIAGEYYVIGVGYDTITQILNGKITSFKLLILIGIFKILNTSLTFAGGGVGGVLAPILLTGASIGAAYGHILHYVFPSQIVDPLPYAVVGMASALAGTTRASLRAIVMIFEMTGEYKIILPLMLASVISDGICHQLIKESIYTAPLIERGITIPKSREVNILQLIKLKEVMSPLPFNLTPNDDIKKAITLTKENNMFILPLINEQKKPIGTLTVPKLLNFQQQSSKTISESNLKIKPPITAHPEETVADLITRLDTDYPFIFITEDGTPNSKCIGIINHQDIVRLMIKHTTK